MRPAWLTFLALIGLLLGGFITSALGLLQTLRPKPIDYLPLTATIFILVGLGTFWTRNPPESITRVNPAEAVFVCPVFVLFIVMFLFVLWSQGGLRF